MSRTCTLKGNPLPLAGEALAVGAKAPDATLKKDLVHDYKLSEGHGRTRIYSVVPSLDTPVCAIQTKRFFEELGRTDGVDFVTVSCDLPVAQARFCGAEGVDPERMRFLSDHVGTEFGLHYGTLIPTLRIQSRAVFVVGPDDTIRHVEYVPEVADEPNYDAALEAARSA